MTILSPTLRTGLRPVAFALALTLASALPALAQDEAAVEAPRREKPFAQMSRMLLGGSKRDSLVSLSRAQVGLRYRLGAKEPGKAFDCSSLVQWVMEKFAVAVPRTAAEQAKVGEPVERNVADLQPGDVLTFGKGRRVTHVGIYIGEGRYVHAANKRKGVIESELPATSTRRGAQWWRGVRRFLHLDRRDTVTVDVSQAIPDSVPLPLPDSARRP